MLYLLLLETALGATWTVNASGGSDFVYIQNAINASSDGDRIEVSAGTYAEALDLGGKDLDIVGVDGAASTTITPPSGEVGVTFDQGEAGIFEGFTIVPSSARAFHLETASPVITDIEIQGGGVLGTIDGGAVYVSGGAPSFDTIDISSSEGRKGGAFYLVDQAIVSVSNVSVDSSSATWGGAFYVDDVNLSLDTVELVDISASKSGGAFYVDDA